MSARLAFYLTPVAERRKLVEFIKKSYILLDVDGYQPGGSTEEIGWWSRVQGRNALKDGCGNNAWYLASAAGTRLADPVSRGLPDLKKAWLAWPLQPEEDRKPKLSAPVQDSPKT